MSNVLLCGESGDADVIDPKEYIMTLLYRKPLHVLITYYDHGLLDFSQIPYDVKLLIVNKCMEKVGWTLLRYNRRFVYSERNWVLSRQVDSKHDVDG